MDAAHAHLVLTHFPVVGLAFAVLLLAYSVLMNSQEARRLGLAALVLIALIALPTYFTGDAAEDIVERLSGVSERTIDQHKDAATVALVGLEILGALALGGLLFSFRKPVPALVASVVVVLSLVSGGLMAWTANLGGQIRHSEIRTAQTGGPGDEQGARTEEQREEDERLTRNASRTK